MLETIRSFWMMDDITFTFAGYYYAVYLAVVIASWFFTITTSPPQLNRQSAPKDKQNGLANYGKSIGSRFVRFVADLPVSPNQITLIGMVLVIFNCGLFASSANTLWLGTGLIAALMFDTLDGLVARQQGTSSSFGGYLDAMVDRYQEGLVYLTIGWVTGMWVPVFLAVTGSMMTSYAKARAAMEIEVANKEWPDLMEKPLRLFVLCVGLIGAPILPWMLPFSLWMLGILTHFTAFQRLARARFLLLDADA